MYQLPWARKHVVETTLEPRGVTLRVNDTLLSYLEAPPGADLELIENEMIEQRALPHLGINKVQVGRHASQWNEAELRRVKFVSNGAEIPMHVAVRL